MEQRRWPYSLQHNHEPPNPSKILCFYDANANRRTIRNDKSDQLEIHVKSGISIYTISTFQVHDIWRADAFNQSLLSISGMLPLKLEKYRIYVGFIIVTFLLTFLTKLCFTTCGSQPPGWLSPMPASWYSHLCVCPSTSYQGWSVRSTEYSRRNGRSLLRWAYERLWLSSWACWSIPGPAGKPAILSWGPIWRRMEVSSQQPGRNWCLPTTMWLRLEVGLPVTDDGNPGWSADCN